LLDTAKVENVDLAEYGLPDELKALSRLTKDIKAKEADNVRRLVRRLSSNPEMHTLQALLMYLNQHHYDADEQTLKTLS